MFLELAIWFLGALCLLVAFCLHRKLAVLQGGIDALSREYYGLSSQLSELGRALRTDLPELQIALRKKLGTLRFEAGMTVGQALLAHSDAARVLGLSGGGCGAAGTGLPEELEPLEIFAQDQGLEIETVLKQLNGLLDGTTRLLPRTAAGFVPADAVRRSSPGAT